MNSITFSIVLQLILNVNLPMPQVSFIYTFFFNKEPIYEKNVRDTLSFKKLLELQEEELRTVLTPNQEIQLCSVRQNRVKRKIFQKLKRK